jgi:hypothetical protein
MPAVDDAKRMGSGRVRPLPGAVNLKNLTWLFLVTVFAIPGFAKTFLSQEDALKLAFPEASVVERQSLFLTADEREEAKKLSGIDFDDELVVRYVGRKGDRIIGFAYFDAHRVRTLPETMMVVILPDGRISRIEILSFNEPQEYLPKPRWLGQLDGKKLDDELSLRRAIRPITGATLSGRAIVNASRKMLAIHEVVGTRGGEK